LVKRLRMCSSFLLVCRYRIPDTWAVKTDRSAAKETVWQRLLSVIPALPVHYETLSTKRRQ
jgi:hypothetical protein